MNRPRPRLTIRNFLALGLLLSLGAIASAQPPAKEKPAKDDQPTDALRGPQVRDRNVPGAPGAFGEPNRRFAGDRLPPQVFEEAIQTIMSEEAPESVRISDEQRAKYEKWRDEFRTTSQTFQREHASELRELQRKIAPNRGGRQGQAERRPPQDDQMRPMEDGAQDSSMDEARSRFQELNALRPKIEDLYTKIWTDLRPDQQKAVDAKLDEYRAEQAKRREDAYVRQRMRDRPASSQPDAAPARPAPDGAAQPRRRPNAPGAQPAPDGQQRPSDRPTRPAAADGQRRERLMRIFSQMSPEEQEQLLERLEQRLRDRGRGDDDRNSPPARRPARRGQDKEGARPAPQDAPTNRPD